MTRKSILIILISIILIVAGTLVLLAFSRTWGKADIEIKLHINEELVQESAFGESPTFAIWLENQNTHKIKTVFVTRRIAEEDWEGKAEVPVALPVWSYVANSLKKLETADKSNQVIVSGATPKPGYFIERVSVEENSKWILWMEVNLAGDFNDNYKEFDDVLKKTDEYATGQPALIYKAKVNAVAGSEIISEIAGISIHGGTTLDSIIKPVTGITTASNIFDEISLHVVKTKPRIINK